MENVQVLKMDCEINIKCGKEKIEDVENLDEFENVQMQKLHHEREFNYRLKNEGVDVVLEGMFDKETVKLVQKNPLMHKLFMLLKQTVKHNLELRQELGVLRK